MYIPDNIESIKFMQHNDSDDTERCILEIPFGCIDHNTQTNTNHIPIGHSNKSTLYNVMCSIESNEYIYQIEAHMDASQIQQMIFNVLCSTSIGTPLDIKMTFYINKEQQFCLYQIKSIDFRITPIE